MVSPRTSINDLVTELLDRRYERAAREVLRVIALRITSGLIAQRLQELEDEARRLNDEGNRLLPDNPVIRALIADLDPVLRRSGQDIANASPALQRLGVQSANVLTERLTFGGLSGQTLGAIGERWNRADPETVNALVGYVNSDAWRSEVGAYGTRVLDTVQNQAIRGIVEGWNPLKTAGTIREMTQALPASAANTTMRTLYIQSYRRGSQVYQRANADILEGQVRVAALDARTCLACVALHGTRLGVGEAIHDHHNGRCVGVPYVRGAERQVRSGEDWFNGLPESQQLQMAGPGKLELLRTGQATLRDFVQTYRDPVYDAMISEASIKGLLARRG